MCLLGLIGGLCDIKIIMCFEKSLAYGKQHVVVIYLSDTVNE